MDQAGNMLDILVQSNRDATADRRFGGEHRRTSEVDRFVTEHNQAGLLAMTRRLRKFGVGEVAIERPDGPVVAALLEAGFTVVVISPNQVKNL